MKEINANEDRIKEMTAEKEVYEEELIAQGVLSGDEELIAE